MDIDCTRCDALIDAFCDGELDAPTAAAVAAHCAGCASCAEALAGTRALVAAAAALPREQSPPAALWSAVAARTVDRPEARAPWLAWAVAATVVAALGGLVALQSGAPRPVDGLAATPRPVGRPELAVANPAMDRRAHLVGAVTRGGKALDPAALATIERNLQVIHAALAEIEAAVQADPNDPNLRRMLTEIHLQESALIERTQRLSIEPNRRTDI